MKTKDLIKYAVRVTIYNSMPNDYYFYGSKYMVELIIITTLKFQTCVIKIA